MSDKKKPILGHFKVMLPKVVSEEEFEGSTTSTGPRATSTGTSENPDTAADVDIDF